MAKIIAYVDGFNTYYALFKGKKEQPPRFPPKFKWINWVVLVEKLFPSDEVVSLRYFTAEVLPTRKDPRQLERQKIYLEALGSLPNVRIVYGKFKERQGEALLVPGLEKVEVLTMEEKGSDVNLASMLLMDSFKRFSKKDFDKAVVISNDSDLTTPVKLAKEQMGVDVHVVNPSTNKDVLRAVPTKPNVQILESHLAGSQFPSPLFVGTKPIRKPDSWV